MKKLYAVAPELLPLIAQACHEANRAYCLALGDESQLPWESAPQWAKDSAAKGVLGVLCSGNTPKQSHASWLAEKESTGWKHGPVKDAVALTHPCMVPYDQLPQEQQQKDHIFVAVCAAMAQGLNLPEVATS